MKVSIVIPSYNQARWLEACLRSVLGQRGVELETIVMDGGSKDGSPAIIERYASKLAYWQSQPDGGQAAAIAAGFARATGDVLGWLNSDDVFMPGALERVVRFFTEHPEEEVVTGGSFFIDAEGRTYRWRWWNQNHTFGVAASHERFLHFVPQQGIAQPATFFRRAAYEAVGGVDAQFQYIMDFDLFTRLSRRRRFARIAEMLACFRIHEANKTHQWKNVFRREMKIWASKYGVDRVPPIERRVRFVGFLLPAVARKALAMARERTGTVRLDAPDWK